MNLDFTLRTLGDIVLIVVLNVVPSLAAKCFHVCYISR